MSSNVRRFFGLRKAKRQRQHEPHIRRRKRARPEFDENTLPEGLRREDRTNAGVWEIIHVLEGRLRHRTLDHVSKMILDPDHSGLVLPDIPHLVEPLGPMRMQVEFYDQPPSEAG